MHFHCNSTAHICSVINNHNLADPLFSSYSAPNPPPPPPSSVCEDLPAGVNWPDSMGALCDFFVTGKIAGNWPGCDTSMDTGVPLHGNNLVIIKAVEKLVRNPVIDANKFQIYHFLILLIEIQKYWAWADKLGR